MAGDAAKRTAMRDTIVRAGMMLRDGLLDAANAVERLGGATSAKIKAGGPFEYTEDGTIDRMLAMLRVNPMHLLQIKKVRQLLAKQRAAALMARSELKRASGGEDVAYNTIEYNIKGAIEAADLDRPARMVNVVTSVERIWKNISALDVLTIGPRSEIEIFALLAAGFVAPRLKALDLFSYSPYVDVGDMHATPYPDNSFDVIFFGWVLSYSRNQRAAAQEILRVSRDRTVIAIAGDYSDDTRDRSFFRNDTTHMQSTDQILSLFDGHVGKIYFRHDPEMPEVEMVMTVFEVRKP